MDQKFQYVQIRTGQFTDEFAVDTVGSCQGKSQTHGKYLARLS